HRALLFDTGTGMVPQRPLVEKLTPLPVTVINSHTHYDHVGGNHEFDRILAIDSPYTRANTAGFPHEELATEVAPEAFCKGAPEGLDTAAYRTRAWKASGSVRDGDSIDLGDRTIEVLQVPGHTPDATALLDRANGLLWTGDSWYDGTLWLYVPETDLDAYERSMARLAALAPGLKQLLPAHNTVSADPARLGMALAAVRRMRTGTVVPVQEESGGRLIFEIDGVSILTSKALLAGQTGERGKGGSGLSVWP
ncbi:MAG: MBL fold metallo-hydrolase, partial [Gammaproteobacteria bacterium]